MKYYHILFEVLKLLLIILFVYTGISKIIGHELFLHQLGKVPIIKSYAGFITWFIPAIEIICAGLFLFNKTEITAWWIAVMLLSIFTIYIALMISFAPLLPCSCGGIIAALSWRQHLVFNTILSIIGWVKLYRHYFIQQFSMHTRE